MIDVKSFCYTGWLIASLFLFACQSTDQKTDGSIDSGHDEMEHPDTGALELVDITALDSSILLDIRYATTDNFVERILYDCPRCLLRKEVAQAVVEVHQNLQKEGLGLKLFDCYRPLSVQERLWSIVPDTNYVADPSKGSNHNRGIAVDLTLVDEKGEQLNMGTRFDHFGLEAHHDFPQFPDSIIINRSKLKHHMIKAGFEPLSSEWWHYAYSSLDAPIREKMWDCPQE